VPPFLAWDTTLEQEEPARGDQIANVSSGTKKDEGALVQLTLYAVEEQMKKKRSDHTKLPLEPGHPFATDYRSGAAFTNVPKVTIDNGLMKTLEVCWQACLQAVGKLPDEDEFGVMNATQGLSRDTADTKAVDTVVAARGNSDPSLDGEKLARRRVTHWQTALMHKLVDLIVHAAMDLIDQFVPRHFAHPLLHMCWGALEGIIKVGL
jgi:hypothetical protein